MKKITGIVIVLLSVFLMSSCTLIGGRSVTTNNGKIADERINEIVDAINNKDEESLTGMFSQYVSGEAEDLSGTVKDLIELFPNGIISWERDSVGSDGSIEYGNKSERIRSYYVVTTDMATYVFYILDYYKNTIESEKLGLFSICVVNEKDEDELIESWEKVAFPGININIIDNGTYPS